MMTGTVTYNPRTRQWHFACPCCGDDCFESTEALALDSVRLLEEAGGSLC